MFFFVHLKVLRAIICYLWLGFASEDLGVLSMSDAGLFVAEESYAGHHFPLYERDVVATDLTPPKLIYVLNRFTQLRHPMVKYLYYFYKVSSSASPSSF